MDSLDHMLTDPLELGPCGEGNVTRIMEDCMLGTTRVSLPEDLLEDVSSAQILYLFGPLVNSTFNSLCGAYRANRKEGKCFRLSWKRCQKGLWLISGKLFKLFCYVFFFLDDNVSYFENICEKVLFDTSFEFIFLLLVVSLISSPFLFTLYCFLHLVRRCLVARVI